MKKTTILILVLVFTIITVTTGYTAGLRYKVGNVWHEPVDLIELDSGQNIALQKFVDANNASTTCYVARTPYGTAMSCVK